MHLPCHWPRDGEWQYPATGSFHESSFWGWHGCWNLSAVHLAKTSGIVTCKAPRDHSSGFHAHHDFMNAKKTITKKEHDAFPVTFSARRLETRPGNLPAALYVYGGRAPTRCSVLEISPEGVLLHDRVSSDDLAQIRTGGNPLWVRIMGLSDMGEFKKMLNALHVPDPIQPVLIETPQAPQLQVYLDDIVLCIHRLYFSKDPSHMISEQVGFYLTSDLLVSVEEFEKHDPYAKLTYWLQNKIPQSCAEDLDDLLHALFEEILHQYFPLLELMSDRLDDLEESVLRSPKPKLLSKAFQLHSNLRRVRRQLWPLLSQIRLFIRQNQASLSTESVERYQDLEQHLNQLFEVSEWLRHQCDAVNQAYMASVSNRMNQVMKTLTIISVIFAPLTFLAGIYGMNFENMPELKWHYGYLFSIILMAIIAAMMSYWLSRRGWFDDWTTTRN
ncbi:MAG: magnesium/cobalt transporter CorA [Synechococcaceae cyanobacterium ELA739]